MQRIPIDEAHLNLHPKTWARGATRVADNTEWSLPGSSHIFRAPDFCCQINHPLPRTNRYPLTINDLPITTNTPRLFTTDKPVSKRPGIGLVWHPTGHITSKCSAQRTSRVYLIFSTASPYDWIPTLLSQRHKRKSDRSRPTDIATQNVASHWLWVG